MIILTAGVLVLLAALLGGSSALFDLANLALVPVAAGCIVAALALVFLSRGKLQRTVLALIAIASGVLLLPPADDPGVCATDSPRLRLAWLNAQGTNDPVPILDWLESEQPDAVGFAELGNGSQAVRDALLEHYPHHQTCLKNQRCSTVIYTRAKPLSREPLGYGNPHNRNGLSAARVALDMGAQDPLNLMAVHLSRPLPLGDQRDELDSIEAQIRQPADTVMIGDFNMTRRMKGLRNFASRNGFKLSATDRPTWPLRYDGEPSTPVVQIDQLLLGRNWTYEGLRTSEDLGSDHRGFVADICRRF